MKTKHYIIAALCFSIYLTSCSNNDEEIENKAAENRPPENFALKSIENEALNTVTSPILSWETAIDPDGDSVSYTLYLDEDETLTKVYKEHISETSITIDEPLAFSTKYYWKIAAMDGNGGTTESEIFSFTTISESLNFTSITDTPAFSVRTGFSTVVFQNKIWVIAGQFFDGNQYVNKNDVWFSEDGENWQKAIENAQFPVRHLHASIVFDNKIWVIGGRGDGNDPEDFYNDVWYSNDGINWIEATSNAFSGRHDHALATFDNKIWMIGGWNLSEGSKNDVWYSKDGVTWVQATSGAPFPKRSSHSVVVFEDKLWVIAGSGNGTYLNDVWYSNDGVTWEAATNEASFSKRNNLVTAVFNDKIWVVAGYNSPNFYNDI
ncbi:hypothetical protein [Algibacter sp. 2305UL17-15]|uniref:Kelch repeat-containing protein n=1 Tax=Algibacter sp. 2305UL17-15 TaxID=3231268 RepID=UPI003457A8EC